MPSQTALVAMILAGFCIVLLFSKEYREGSLGGAVGWENRRGISSLTARLFLAVAALFFIWMAVMSWNQIDHKKLRQSGASSGAVHQESLLLRL